MAAEPHIIAIETSSRVGSAALARGGCLLEETTFSAPLRHSAELLPAVRKLLEKHHLGPGDVGQLHLSIGPGSFTGLRIAVAMAKAAALAGSVKIVTVDTLDVIAANVLEVPDGRRIMPDAGKPPQAPVENTGDPMPNRPIRLAPLLDAKRGQFFTALYRRLAPPTNHNMEPGATQTDRPTNAPDESFDLDYKKVVPDCLLTSQEIIERFTDPAEPLYILGDGLLCHRRHFEDGRGVILDESLWSPRASVVHRLAWPKACAGDFADPVTLAPFYLRRPEPEEKRMTANT
ncbi:MAG TPA: tRNA (adenosine(37)-N6)-threonylcarbamoyltransferase complex dimerization subunit type 1 TsaB [Phycisphaerales bacterium]|nr:tRNA (adenosine(37)-N6)-threonylcarbamoyltransferase complex dimerization subunit type 1 TsaB [Phycisphaerales bacterium]